MNNLTRFFIGLAAFFLFAILAAGLIALFGPLLIGVSMVLYTLIMILLPIIALVAFFVFIWYLSRKEEPLPDNKDYKISQGKDK